MEQLLFHSKSARLPTAPSLSPSLPVTPTRLKDEVLFWLGISDGIRAWGEALGFDIRDVEGAYEDASMIVSSRALIFCEIILEPRTIQLLGVANNYGVPVAWLHSCIVPHHWMWEFQLCMVGKFTAGAFWGKLCQILK